MKSLLILISFVCLFSFAKASEIEHPIKRIECHTRHEFQGIFFRECPLGSVVVGVNVVPNGRFLYTQVKCERQITVCKEIPEKIKDNELIQDSF